MELTTEQKAAIFDWLCERAMVSIRDYGLPSMHLEYYMGIVATEKRKKPVAQAIYNAYRKDTGNE